MTYNVTLLRNLNKNIHIEAKNKILTTKGEDKTNKLGHCEYEQTIKIK